MTGKRWGRIGDSPVIGAGTYAADGICAVSATGSGEFFIRTSAARQLCDRIAWNGEGVLAAAQTPSKTSATSAVTAVSSRWMGRATSRSP